MASKKPSPEHAKTSSMSAPVTEELHPQSELLTDSGLALGKPELGRHGRHQKISDRRIYDAVMRSGGEPFLTPFTRGLSTLTEKVVQFFKQRGFFGFETMEHVRGPEKRNKFTRAGAARHSGELKRKGHKP